jgi:acetyltransferase
VLASGREMLTEPEAKAVLDAYRIPVVATRVVPPDPQAAADMATRIGFPVVLKILSPDISHKSDVGGVALGLDNAEAVREAAAAMLARVRRLLPEARLEGFTVQAMVRRTHAQEIIVGASHRPRVRPGHPVRAGRHGGRGAWPTAPVALPPLNVPLARALVSRTRVSRLLEGWRDTPPADLDAVCATLMAVSQLLADIPELAELDINPLIVNHEGAMALDARIRLSARAPGGAENFAIRPYPAELASQIDLEWAHGRLLRPIRPEDEAQHVEFLTHLDPEDIRMRVFYSRRSIERSELARLTQIDYDPRDGLHRGGDRSGRRAADPGRGPRRGRPRQHQRRVRHHRPLRAQGLRAWAPADGALDRLPARQRHPAAGGHRAAREHAHAGPGGRAGLS